MNVKDENCTNRKSPAFKKCLKGVHKDAMCIVFKHFFSSVILQNESLVSKEIFCMLNLVENCISNFKKLGDVGNKVGYQKLLNSARRTRAEVLNCLDKDVSDVINNICINEILRIQTFLEENGAKVVFSNKNSIVWTFEKNVSINIDSEYYFELHHEKFDMVIYSPSRFYSPIFNMFRNECKFVYDTYDFFTKKLCGKYSEKEFIEDMYNLCKDLVSGKIKNDDFNKTFTVNSYKCRTYYLNIFWKKLMDEGKNYNVGDKVQYQVVKDNCNLSHQVVKDNLDGNCNLINQVVKDNSDVNCNLRLPSDENEIDYSHYLLSLKNTETFFSTKNHIQIFIEKMKSGYKFDDFERFYEENYLSV